jgi:hypothetical protein
MWHVEAYLGGRSVALFFVPLSRSRWVTNQLRELRESLMPVAMGIAEATTAERVKVARRADREATLGGGGSKHEKRVRCCHDRVVLHPRGASS